MSFRAHVDLAAIAAAVARHEAIAAAWLFGSLARGDATQTSDLDLAVLLARPRDSATGDDLAELSLALERWSPSRRVDIVVLGGQGPVFRHRVLSEGVLLVDRDPTLRRRFEARTTIDYLDWKPTHDIAMASTMAGLRRRFSGASR